MPEHLHIEDIKTVYFIGIGGIGMSALARYFHSKGVVVSGYDKTETELTRSLQQEGIEVHFEDNPSLSPTNPDIVVYTPAIPASNSILHHFLHSGKTLYKRSDILGMISQSTFNICIAGTHGKTTTSTMVAHILRDSGYGCNAFLGGISANYQSNFWSHANPVAVIEADEYDRSFLKLTPNIASVSSMDPDHLDIYGTATEMEKAYIDFTKQLKANGLLLTKKGLPCESLLHAQTHYTYHFNNRTADIHTTSFSIDRGSYVYDLVGPGWELKGVRLNMGGIHNVENSLVAIGIAKHLGIEDEKITKAVSSFAGVKRRFEYILKNDAHVFIDDYAHHPAELTALISGVRSLYPNSSLTLIFQPHLYTRTRDLVKEFAESLDLADEVILLPIYPARELPISGVESSLVASNMKNNVRLMDAEQVVSHIKQSKPSVLITAGAGDIDRLILPLKKALLNS